MYLFVFYVKQFLINCAEGPSKSYIYLLYEVASPLLISSHYYEEKKTIKTLENNQLTRRNEQQLAVNLRQARMLHKPLLLHHSSFSKLTTSKEIRRIQNFHLQSQCEIVLYRHSNRNKFGIMKATEIYFTWASVSNPVGKRVAFFIATFVFWF